MCPALTALTTCPVQAIDATGKRKDAAFLVNVHEELVEGLFNTYYPLPNPEQLTGTAYATALAKAQAARARFIGTVMDNTSTNMAASARLEQLHPTWICIGCIAHALNLLFKDLAKQARKEEDEEPRRKRAKPAKVISLAGRLRGGGF